MAVDVCSDIPSLVSSPRISFSLYLNQSDTVPIEHYHPRSDPFLFDPDFTFDFDFDFHSANSFTKLSSADDLFSNGKILPFEINNQVVKPNPTSVCVNSNETTKKKRLKEFLQIDFDEDNPKPMPKSFWQFSRSSSLNFDSARSMSLIRLPHFLSRSNSTGSAPNPMKTANSKDNQNRHSFKQPPVAINSQSFGYNYPYNSSTRPPLRKDFRSCSNRGVRFSPVLNFPHNCIAKGSVSLFGFGSLFCNGKAKKKKK